ncbi:hypothetical protein F1C10_14615 [Sphingomonas sp. NBWT7]|uniref:hypothetical protein n=1 Tax=Sphingomonas sp. NBWT7 TaxID=2596913 RepID=UPI0016247D60|nr:hypothetical protein [Sphingomonas sp. NBWT7]QNE33028.1 hypothetical protein F1C10_14615 [Sphingomonas sp. NBWT7]
MAGKESKHREAARKGWERGGGGRTEWKTWHVVTVASLGAVTAGIVALGSSTPVPESPAPRAETKAPSVAQASPCKIRFVIERDAAVKDDTVLLRAPASKAAPIANSQGKTNLSDIKALAAITPEMPLRVMCEEGAWSRVRVLATGLRWMEGWVPNKALRKLVLDDAGHRVLTAADLQWQPGSGSDRREIVKIANLILRNDKRCEAIDERSLLVEGSRSDRRYTLLCDGPGGSFPITFTARDAASRSFPGVADPAGSDPSGEASFSAPISKADAADACIDAITAQLAQPRSADFHTFTDTTFNVDGARARFTVGFDAKNGLGLEVEQTAACIFEGDSLASAEILPAGS